MGLIMRKNLYSKHFNRDDVLACMMLKNFVTKYKDYQIIRSRDE